MHYDNLFRAQLPIIRSFDWFKPSILQVRIPDAGNQNEAAGQQQNGLEDILVSDLLDREPVNELSQAAIAALLAWDFCLGMIFASILTRKKDEDRDSLMRRIEPNLFLHLAGWDTDPGDPTAL